MVGVGGAGAGIGDAVEFVWGGSYPLGADGGGWAEADGEDLEEWRDEELVRLHLLDRKGEELFGLHPLVREFLQGKLKGRDKAVAWRSAFAEALKTVAEQFLSQTMTVDEVTQTDVLIPHLKEVATFDLAQSSGLRCNL